MEKENKTELTFQIDTLGTKQVSSDTNRKLSHDIIEFSIES